MVLVGLRVTVAEGVWAEVLGMGPFEFLPPTRRCPITSLEIRVKPDKARRSKTTLGMLAAHLDKVPTGSMLTPRQYQALFARFTPWLKRRILGGEPDARAKAGVTFAFPAAIWEVLRPARP